MLASAFKSPLANSINDSMYDGQLFQTNILDAIMKAWMVSNTLFHVIQKVFL